MFPVIVQTFTPSCFRVQRYGGRTLFQGAIRQAKAELTPTHAAAKERQGGEDITVLSCWKTIKKVLFIMPYE